MLTRFLKIKDTTFKLDYSFMSCFRYRMLYGVSIVEEMENIKECITKNPVILTRILERVIYVSIIKPQMNFEEFKKIVRADKEFTLSALNFLTYLLKDNAIKCEDKIENKLKNEEKFDELKIVSIYSKLSLPESLLKEMNVFQICELISINNQLFDNSKKETKKYRKFNDTEMKTLYG